MKIGDYVIYQNFKFQIETNTNSEIIPVKNTNPDIVSLYYRLDKIDNLAWFKIWPPKSMRIKVVRDYEEVFWESGVSFDFNGYQPHRILWRPRIVSQMLRSGWASGKVAEQLEKLREDLTKQGYYGELLMDRSGECYKHDNAILKVPYPDAIIPPFGKPRSYVSAMVKQYLARKGVFR